MLRKLWVDHQKFLLVCASVALAFLVVNSWISALAEGADRTYGRCRDLARNIDRLHGDLDETYWLERRRADAYEKAETELVSELGLPEPSVPGDAGSLLIDLNRRVDRVWAEAQKRANPRGLALPEKLSPKDFDIEADYGPREYRILHAYLTVVERALLIAVDAGVSAIGEPQLIPWIQSPIALDGVEVGSSSYLGATFTVRGTWDSFLRLFALAQEPGRFLQVRMTGKLEPVKDDEEMLEAELEFFGLWIRPVEPEASESGGFPALEEKGPALGGKTRARR